MHTRTNSSIDVDALTCKKCGAVLMSDAIFCHKCGKRQAPEPKRHYRRPNGAGTVYKLSGNRARPWVAAKNKIILGYHTTKADAIAALEKVADKVITERYDMTFKEVYDEWKSEHDRDIAENSKRDYDIAYNHFKALQGKRFRHLRTADYQKIIDERAEDEKSRSGINKDRGVINQMYKYAMREEIVTVNYAQFLKLGGKVTKEKIKFSDTEVKQLREAAKTDDAAKIVCMLIDTGMRIGELFSLKAANAFDKYVIGGEKSEAGRNRISPIRPESRPYFAEMKSKSENDLFISGYSGQHDIDNYRKREYYPLLERLGIPRKTPHATRHTFASWAVRSGMPRETLQKILGHAQYETTANIYVHSDIDALIQAVEPAKNTTTNTVTITDTNTKISVN